jgi:replicative DNA helicase
MTSKSGTAAARALLSKPSHEYSPLPANLGAERAILGAILEDAAIRSAVLREGLTADDFSFSEHQLTWKTVQEMHREGLPIDLISVLDRAPEISGATLAETIHGVVLDQSHILHHTTIVKRKSRLRRLLHLGEWITTQAYLPTADPQAIEARIAAELGVQQ